MGLRVNALMPSPNVSGVSVRSPIAVVFDGPIDPATINDAIKLTPPVSGSIAAVSLPDDSQPTVRQTESPSPTGSSGATGDNVLVFTPDSPLAVDTTYTVEMSSGVRRTYGEAASEETWTFVTGEPPANALNQIAFLSDRAGAANVWLMNPDGSNQREVTAELVPVNGFDVSGDGTTIAYGAAGQVKRMRIDGGDPQVLTATGAFDYAPTFTPDGTALVVGRRDSAGADLGYWRIPTVSGADPSQLTPDGAPGLGSVTLQGVGLMGSSREPSWAPRSALSADGKRLLVVRGQDDAVELVDVTGATPPQEFGLTGNSRPIWDQQDNSFYVVATPDAGATWSCFQVTTTGIVTRIGPAAGGLAIAVAPGTSNGSVVFAVGAADGSTHLAFAASATAPMSGLLAADPTWCEGSPSFSPDGSLIVFGRFETRSPTFSGGIWVVEPNGSGLTNLAPDGAYPRWLP